MADNAGATSILIVDHDSATGEASMPATGCRWKDRLTTVQARLNHTGESMAQQAAHAGTRDVQIILQAQRLHAGRTSPRVFVR